MKVCFRADASLQIGSGHVMRCLTLADALCSQGASCCFITRRHPGNLIAAIRQKGFAVYELPEDEAFTVTDEGEPPHARWLGSDWHSDAQQVIQVLQEFDPDWLVVDHYALDFRWQRALRPFCQRIMVVDDLADRKHDCDLLLDQTLGREPAAYRALVPSAAVVKTGVQYALLRPEFAQWRERSLQRRNRSRLQNVLITMGGVDQNNTTGRVLAMLRSSNLPSDCRITVVMGEQAPCLESVKQLITTLPWSAELLINVKNMAQLMVKSDVAIGASGGSSWERCCLGLPTILVVLAENQWSNALAQESAGAAVLLKNIDEQSHDLEALLNNLSDMTILNSMSGMAAKLCDGEGASRTLRLMIDLSG